MKIKKNRKKTGKHRRGFKAATDDEDLLMQAAGGEEYGENRDFFDLSSKEEIRKYRERPAIISPVRTRREYGPIFKYVPFLLVAAAIVVVVYLLWPSSTVAVPKLVGKTIDKAMGAARDSGFKPSIESWEYSGTSGDGIVIAQSPTADKKVSKDDRAISLTVSKGPSPELGREITPPEIKETEQSHVEAESGAVICLDPGHQAVSGDPEWLNPGKTSKVIWDLGEKGTLTQTPEYEVTLEIALRCKDLLEKDGIDVVMTRESGNIELSNVNRAETANNAFADLYLRIHCAYSQDPALSGTSTLYPENSKWNQETYAESKTAALYLQSEVVQSCDTTDLGVHSVKDNPGLNWSRCPTAEVEVAYLSNPLEDKELSKNEFQWKAAQGLRNGIRKYLENR